MATLDALASQSLPAASFAPADDPISQSSVPASLSAAAPSPYWIGTRPSWPVSTSSQHVFPDALTAPSASNSQNISPTMYDMSPFPTSLPQQPPPPPPPMAHPMLAPAPAPAGDSSQSSSPQSPSLSIDPYAPIQPRLPATGSPPAHHQHPLTYRPWPSYSLPAMNGPVLTNLHNPNGQMSMVGNMPSTTGILPGLNSGQVASLQHMYAAGPTVSPHPGPSSGPAHDRPFKCDQCPQSFNRNHDLKRHKRIHLSVKPFPCTHCDKSFSRKDALKVSLSCLLATEY